MVSASALRYRGASVDMSHQSEKLSSAAARSTFVPAFSWAFALGLFVVSNVAVAAPPTTGGGAGPEAEACAGRTVGDACTLPNRALGTCGQGTCNRLDYSQGSPPKAIEEPCVICKATPDHGSGPALGGTTGAEPDEPATTSAGAGATADKEPPKSESRCGIDPDRGRDPVGLVGLAAMMLLLGVRKVRRGE